MNHIAIVVLATGLIVLFALLAASVAGVLARLDGATYPSALTRASAAFVSAIALATAVAGVLGQFLS